MKLAVSAFALSLVLASACLLSGSVSLLSASAAVLPSSQLPATQPGVTRDEGTFLVTAADDGSRVNYFIAGNARHAVLPADMQVELQLNPLWPVRMASRDEILAFPEGAPVGAAKGGLIVAPVQDSAAPDLDMDPRTEIVAEVAPATTFDQPTTYVLKPGDNLTHVSAQFGTSIDAILVANGISNPNRIYVGQTLVIPGAVVAESPTVDETVGESSAVDETVAEAPLAGAPADETLAATTYTVKPGDSAIGIARQFGVTLDELLATNGVIDRNRVYVGQVLTIPGSSS